MKQQIQDSNVLWEGLDQEKLQELEAVANMLQEEQKKKLSEVEKRRRLLSQEQSFNKNHPTPRSGLLRTKDVAEMLGVSRRQASTLMNDMKRINVGVSANHPVWAVEQAEVIAFLEARTVPPETCTLIRHQHKKKRLVEPNGNALLDENGHIPRKPCATKAKR